MALQQGTIDGMEGVPDVMVSSRFYEAIKYVSLNNYNFDFFFATFSNDFYDGLSNEDQDSLCRPARTRRNTPVNKRAERMTRPSSS